MAKAKSKKITLEEVLVPIEEQPYVIPENWCWVRPLSVLEIEYGKGLSTKELAGDGYPVFGANGQIGYYSEYMFKEEMALMSCRGAYSGTMNCSLPYSYVTSNSLIMKDIDGVFTSSKFIYYMYSALNTKKLVSGSAQPQVTVQAFKDFAIPLPPLAEQKRIVAQIESLFSKLDEAKEKAQEVIDGYEARNAAVYNAAFSGRLTAQWRKDNYKENKWEKKRFDEVANIKSNLVDPSDYLEYPHIAPDNIEKRTGILLDYHTIAEDGVKSGKHRFYAGQILYSKIRPYLSKVVMADFDGLCSADMYPIEAKENTKYLLYYMLSDMFLEQASSAGSRSVLPKINQKELSAIKVRITSAEEQEEVVRILDYILPMMQQVRDKAIQVVDNIDIMKKSILAKAFRGKLGTNIPEDESAMELLKIILNKGEC